MAASDRFDDDAPVFQVHAGNVEMDGIGMERTVPGGIPRAEPAGRRHGRYCRS